MTLYIYNTLSRSKEKFIPQNSNAVKMYVCGPTVYDIPHIGNARSVVVYDVLYRVLRLLYGNDRVVYVRNITDIDDKIIYRAQELNTSISTLTTQSTAKFHADMSYLGCLPPNVEPKATEHIGVMIEIISSLLRRGHAYITDDGHVYFAVTSYKNYHLLSGRTFDSMVTNTREIKEQNKRHVADFVLWKPTDSTQEISEAVFDSPWGRGRPGWHIECSAMSYKFLGTSFDIHGGGADLIFPHHTNEIAQSRCAFPESDYARYWVHNGFLTVNGEKMSKSLGNFVTVDDLQKQNISGEVLRLMFISKHYRKPLDFSQKALHDAQSIVQYLYNAVNTVTAPNVEDEIKQELITSFTSALLDDLNTAKAITILLDIAKQVHQEDSIHEKRILIQTLIHAGNLMGILQPQYYVSKVDKNNSTSDINLLLDKRQQLKKQQNWQLADQIRAQLLEQGIILTDHADGTTSWKRAK